MNVNETTINGGQSPGLDPKSKRNSGLFAFFKWFKTSSTSRESIYSTTSSSSSSASCESLTSLGTVASFSFVPPNNYKSPENKSINPGPETDTYRARLKQRDKRRESDKNITLRKKYNLFFHRDIDVNTKSLPLMTRNNIMNDSDEKLHRRTNSESSKIKRAGAYLHVKGKRKAPQPPTKTQSTPSTMSLKRKKRLAPLPPTHINNNSVIYNDSLKLDDGILKPMKEKDANILEDENSLKARSDLCSVVVATTKPWYKRKEKSNYSDDKRRSGLFQTNISELDREATEIVEKIQKNHQKNEQEMMPEFMRPKIDTTNDDDTLLTMSSTSTSPNKRRSARDLIAKFNAITNVTKVTVFGVKDNQKREYFGNKKQEYMLETHKKRIEQIDKKLHGQDEKKMNVLMKSESASAVKLTTTPKTERKNWKCPKCNLENEYWRIICHVCSTIKPYFDDFASNSKDLKPSSPIINVRKNIATINDGLLERSKTQIGFSALATYNEKRKLEKSVSLDENKAEKDNKSDEKEKLKKMLIEMKNSLPKRKSHMLNQNSRASIIEEITENNDINVQNVEDVVKPEKCEVLITTTQTIYENIKIKKTNNLSKPIKVSSSSQTNNIPKETVPPNSIKNLLQNSKTNNYELMRPKDFENIYTDKNSPAKIYANLARNDDLSLFFNMPKRFNDIKSNLNDNNVHNTDTIEINRLLRRLETAIAKGELTEAALFAKELAQLKVNCSVIRQKVVNDANGSQQAEKKTFQIEMFVEDKISHRGPFPIQVNENQTVFDLKKQIEKEFEIPANVQRWILGKELAVNEDATLKDHHITSEGCPVFLYLVAPDAKPVEDQPTTSKAVQLPKESETEPKHIPKIVNVIPKPVIPESVVNFNKPNEPSTSYVEKKSQEDEYYDTKTLKPEKDEWECHLCTLLNPISSNICAICASIRSSKVRPIKKKKILPQTPTPNHYMQLINLDNADLVLNNEKFECVVCLTEIDIGNGCTLRECLHQFCKECLANTIEYCDEAEVRCPYRDENYACNLTLQDREIKALVTPTIYERHLAKSIKQAENKSGKSFHCKTVDCKGWCIFEDNVNEFRCPICRQINCLTCQAIHTNLNCKQYQEKMKTDSEIDDDAKRTKEMLDEMVNKGEALTCPTCKVVLMKKWGCDWLRCSMCKTEICWVTRGPRWGPAGKGDTSGGCQCGVNGVKCHPQCNYCH